MSAANPQASPAASSVPAPSSVALGSDLAASAAAAAAASSSSSSSPPPPTAANVAAQGAPGPSTPLVQSQAGPALSQGNMVITPMPPPAVPQNVKLESGHVVDKVDKPFVYGSAAFWQGKNISETQHSHKWTVYLRGLENEDLSYFIKSVAFTLHQSFTEPTRVLYAAPYEVTETGWGEFMIGITINFHDVSGLDPIQLQHSLKLFPGQNIQPTTKRPVMSEVYDEFVFVNPTKEWFDMLHSGPTKKVDHHPLMPYFITPEFAKDEDMAIAKLQAANETIQLQLDQQRAKLFLLDNEIASLTQKL